MRAQSAKKNLNYFSFYACISHKVCKNVWHSLIQNNPTKTKQGKQKMKNLNTKFPFRMPIKSFLRGDGRIYKYAFESGVELTLDCEKQEMFVEENGEPAFVNDFNFEDFVFMTIEGGKSWRELQAEFSHCIQINL